MLQPTAPTTEQRLIQAMKSCAGRVQKSSDPQARAAVEQMLKEAKKVVK